MCCCLSYLCIHSPFGCRGFELSHFVSLIVSCLSFFVATAHTILQTSTLFRSLIGHDATGSAFSAVSVFERLTRSDCLQAVKCTNLSCLYHLTVIVSGIHSLQWSISIYSRSVLVYLFLSSFILPLRWRIRGVQALSQGTVVYVTLRFLWTSISASIRAF